MRKSWLRNLIYFNHSDSVFTLYLILNNSIIAKTLFINYLMHWSLNGLSFIRENVHNTTLIILYSTKVQVIENNIT